jgi:hypothetical protein
MDTGDGYVGFFREAKKASKTYPLKPAVADNPIAHDRND